MHGQETTGCNLLQLKSARATGGVIAVNRMELKMNRTREKGRARESPIVPLAITIWPLISSSPRSPHRRS